MKQKQKLPSREWEQIGRIGQVSSFQTLGKKGSGILSKNWSTQRTAIEAQQWEIADRKGKMVVCRDPEWELADRTRRWRCVETQSVILSPSCTNGSIRIVGFNAFWRLGKNGIWRVTQSQCLPFNFTNVMACTGKIYRDKEFWPLPQTGFGVLRPWGYW